MKKTLTINLGGSVFNIDEDAYQLLDKYLNNLRIHFRREPALRMATNKISPFAGKRVQYAVRISAVRKKVRTTNDLRPFFHERFPLSPKRPLPRFLSVRTRRSKNKEFGGCP